MINALIFPKTKGQPRGLTAEGQDVWLISREQTLKFDDKAYSWPYAFGVVQSLPIQPVGFTINKSANPMSLTPEIVPDWFNPDRGLEFVPATRTMPPLAPLAALQEGMNETIENVTMLYASIRSLFSGRVSTRTSAGRS